MIELFLCSLCGAEVSAPSAARHQPAERELTPAPAAPRSARPPLCPPLPQSDGAEGARRVPRLAPLGNGRLRQPRRAGDWRRRPQAGRRFLHRQMHLQVPESPDHPHLRLLQALPGRGMAPRRPPPPLLPGPPGGWVSPATGAADAM